jgi:predicted acylesterase/phospholipase RssA
MGGGTTRRALALAGGGVVGGLYEVGALLALDDLFDGFDTCDFDFYVGASAGAFVSALLANHVSPAQLRETLQRDRRALPRLTGAQFLSLPWRAYLDTVPRLAAALPRLGAGLWKQWHETLLLPTLATLFRALPRGLFTLEGLERYVRHALTQRGRSNDFRHLRRRLLIPATTLDTGAIRVFGARLDERTPIARAVAASAAIPLLFEPVTIDGVDYVDATVTKTAHAGLAAERGARLVIVINPLRPLVVRDGRDGGAAAAGALAIAGQALRIAVHRRLHDGLRHYADAHPGTDVLLLEPWERDLKLFDYPLMTYALRHEIIERAYQTTVRTVLDGYERWASVLDRHGIGLLARDDIERRARVWPVTRRQVA